MTTQAALRNPFTDSAVASIRTDSSRSEHSTFFRQPPKHRFESYHLKGPYERPWADGSRQKRSRLGNYIIWGFVALGFILSAVINFFSWQKVPQHQVGSSHRNN